MARKLVISRRNRADGDDVALTASHEAGDLVAANLTDASLPKVWRANAVSGVSLVIDLGAAFEIGLVGFVNSNLTAAATMRWRAASSEANLTADPDYDSDSDDASWTPWPAASAVEIQGYVNPLLLPDPAVEKRWWRVDVDDADNSDGYLEFGRLVIADVITPARNWQRGSRFGVVDPSVTALSRGGQPIDRVESKRRSLELVLSWLTESEMLDDLMDLDLAVGTTGDVYVVPFPDKVTQYHRLAVWGRMTELQPYEYVALSRYARGLRVVERL